MGWTTFQKVEENYNEEIRAIDEQLLKLMNERKRVADGKRLFPPSELIEEWSKAYEMELPEISWFMHSIQDGSTPFRFPEGPGELISVTPIMKKSKLDEFEYILTHSMQHENGSYIHLEICHQDHDERIGHIQAHLMLHIAGPTPYHVSQHNGHGSGGKTEMTFLCSPRIPDDMSQISFTLLPYKMPMAERPKEIILDKEVKF